MLYVWKCLVTRHHIGLFFQGCCAKQVRKSGTGLMLDGHEKSLEVSVKQPRSSPAKQKTLDSFVKRCNSLNSEQQSDPKHQRH
ncbi:hypothetical protein Ccrd_001518 [Cynara cardunculus var. scolymus]|uniref:Uncharacterized protein n=1 Tax=Cynara cardunculus var. scolymus TaxID=59895 RepID=A0A103XT73_CYNCS|nr:hypothetical protein Ccrd_001518 [Cynara cardunculus var. scolymus]